VILVMQPFRAGNEADAVVEMLSDMGYSVSSRFIGIVMPWLEACAISVFVNTDAEKKYVLKLVEYVVGRTLVFYIDQ